jgi:serine/threonine protein kinase
MSVLAPGAVVGGCRIEGVVGRGGMGVVYLARQLELERDVALKVISSELTEDPVARGRFLAEARAAAAVEHPNVVPVHAVGTEDELTYLVMRLIRGDDLRAVVRRDGPLDPSRAAAIAERIGDALDAIHRAGYVHRDVKPPNVLIDDDGHVYLSDFGLAKAALASQGPTTADHWVGTLDYVAPEQIRGAAVDARTDVYALGGVLNFMLTGLPPFVREGDEAKLWAHLHDPPPRPSTTPGVPLGFDSIVARALAKEPVDRYSSAGELGRDALAAARGDDPTAVTVIARRPSRPAKEKGMGKRRWRGLAGLAAAAVMGAVGALLLTGDPEGAPPGRGSTPTPTQTPDPTPEPVLTVKGTHDIRTNLPEELAISGRYAWIIASSRSHPVRFDLRTDTARFGPDLGRGASAIVADRGKVWIAYKTQNRVVQLDAETGDYIGQLNTPIGPTALAVGSTGLWVATQDRRDDPAYLRRYTRTGEFLEETPILNGVADMVHGAGAMWMAVEDTSALRRWGAGGGSRFWASLPARGTDLAYGRGAIWALCEEPTLTRVDPENARRSYAPDIPSTPQEVGISGPLAIVTLRTDKRLHVVDTGTMEKAKGPPVELKGYGFGVASRGQRSYVTTQDRDALVELER